MQPADGITGNHVSHLTEATISHIIAMVVLRQASGHRVDKIHYSGDSVEYGSRKNAKLFYVFP
jgi:hypothetical protein